MIEIKTQEEFDYIVNNTPNNELIRIHPLKNEEAYSLNQIWSLNSGTFIEGVRNPKIKFTGDYTSTSRAGMIEIKGSNGAEKENIVIRGLALLGKIVTGSLIGIYAEYVGKAPTAGLSSGGYDSSTGGNSIENKIGVRIENCTIEGFQHDGIYLLLASNNTVTGNTVQNNSHGIYLSASNNTIIGNTVQNNGGRGIFTSGRNNIITGNTVQNNGTYGINVSSSNRNNNTIIGNTVQNNGTYGINAVSSSRNTIIANTVQNNGTYGIYLASSNNNAVIGNTVQDNITDGIFISSSNNNTTIGNFIKNNRNGIHLYLSSNNNIAYGNVTIDNSIPFSNVGTNNEISSTYNKFIS